MSDGNDVVIAGIMEHVEEAGIHSGDSTCYLPPISVGAKVLDEIRETTVALARELGVVGLMNVQYALKGERLYIIEVNPRGSRTVPFVSKATGTPFAKIAALLGAGKTIAELGVRERVPEHVSVKVPVFPFMKFPGVDVLLSPEMRSTGEVMGIAKDFGAAFHAGMSGAGVELPQAGVVFISVGDNDKDAGDPGGQAPAPAGVLAASDPWDGAAPARARHQCETVNKVLEGRPHIVDRMVNGEVAMVINTSLGEQADARLAVDSADRAGPAHSLLHDHLGGPRDRPRDRGRPRRRPGARGGVAAGVPPPSPARARGRAGHAPTESDLAARVTTGS